MKGWRKEEGCWLHFASSFDKLTTSADEPVTAVKDALRREATGGERGGRRERHEE